MEDMTTTTSTLDTTTGATPTPTVDFEAEIKQLKASLDKASSEAASWKKKYKDTISEAERKALEDAEAATALEERYKALEKENLTYKYTKQYMGLGYTEEMAEQAAKAQIEENHDAMFKIQSQFLEMKRKEFKASILKGIPSAPTGQEAPQMTKEEFSKLSYKETVEFKQKYPEMFKEFTK